MRQELEWTRNLLELPSAAKTDMFRLIELTLSRYPDVDLDLEAFQFVDYYRNSRRTIKSLPRTWFAWLKIAQNGHKNGKSNGDDTANRYEQYASRKQDLRVDR